MESSDSPQTMDKMVLPMSLPSSQTISSQRELSECILLMKTAPLKLPLEALMSNTTAETSNGLTSLEHPGGKSTSQLEASMASPSSRADKLPLLTQAPPSLLCPSPTWDNSLPISPSLSAPLLIALWPCATMKCFAMIWLINLLIWNSASVLKVFLTAFLLLSICSTEKSLASQPGTAC